MRPPLPTAGSAVALDAAAIDRAFARLLVRRLAPARDAARMAARGDVDAVRTLDPLLYHTALLVSTERAQGNSCAALATWAGQTVVEGEGAAPFTFPALEAWVAALQVSGACETVGAPAGDDPLERAPLRLEGTRLYLTRFAEAEQRVATQILARVGAVEAPAPSALADALFPAAAPGDQRAAAMAALGQRLVFITGGPGTGKTTMAARVLALLLEQDPTRRIALAAPTGRAAARLGDSMSAAIARAALPPAIADRLPRRGVTLHRLLGYRPGDDGFASTAAQPLADDVVVVDEASMIDLLLMDALLAAVRPDARLIVLGDPDQLASVDTGFVLGDIVRAAATPGAPAALAGAVAQLTVSHRFDPRSGIGALAAAARTGDADGLLAALAPGVHDEISWRPARGSSLRALLEPVQGPLDAYLASRTAAEALAALRRFRILVARRDGEAGVSGLNATIERWLQRRGLLTGPWYAHRPVLITQNDPATQLYNGDVGTTLLVDGDPVVYFDGPDGPRAVAPARLPAHETAWAMTVHKAQGSEFDQVLFVLPDADSRLLTRELLYTGITRARQAVHVVGSETTLRHTVHRSVARASGLVDRLSR